MSKSTKNRKKRSTNMSRVLLKELQATIAVACFDSPTLIKRGPSLCEGAIQDPFAHKSLLDIHLSYDSTMSQVIEYSSSY